MDDETFDELVEFARIQLGGPLDTRTRRQRELDEQAGLALHRASRELPEGWQITVQVERGAGWVELESADGESVPLSPDPMTDGGMGYAILSALRVAIETDSANNPR